MKKFAVIGLGRFGTSIAERLAEKGQQVLAIDNREDLVQNIMDKVTKAVCLDATDEKAVKSVGVQNVDVAICGIGTNMEASILVTLLMKEMNIPVIICKGESIAHKKVLKKIGATKVILPEKDTGARIAETLISVSDRVLDHIGISGGASIIEIIAHDEFVGKTLKELNMRARHRVNIIAIKRKKKDVSNDENETVNVTPMADDVVKKGDILVVLGENDNIEELKAHGE
jgi:trk system potassium uptake protein